MSTQIPKKPPRDALFSEIGATVEDHIAWYHHMQETQPIRYRPEYDLWEVFRYKDAQQVLSDYATFAVEGSLPEGWLGALGKVDPPQHRQVRGLVSKAFTPRRVQELTPRLIQIVDGWLERTLARGKMDVASELAYPLPSRVIAEILGLPPEDQERFHQWAYQLIRHVMGITHADMSEIFQYFSDLIDERKRNPHDDLISGLMAAEENGAHLTHEEIIYLCLELMVAGNVTTTILLNRAPYRFCLNPEIYQALRADPSLIPGAIEETLRHDFSRSNVWRTARHDTVLDGHEIKAGQLVAIWTAAANFDETHFPHSEQFDIRRSPNHHFMFGHGIHVCLGASLARLEARIAIERMVAHFSEMRLDPERPVQFLDGMGSFRLIRSLDILFTSAGSSS